MTRRSSGGLHSRYGRWFARKPQTVVVQPTSFCNMGCFYCYLRDKGLKNDMLPATAAAVAESLAGLTGTGHPLGLVWHGGEPLTMGTEKFSALLAPFEALRLDGRLHHYVQTNATLVTPAWCDLLEDLEFRVGVSVDGPAALNTQRVDLQGRPAFERIMRGVDLLRERGIPFSVITVVGQEGIDHPEELLDFLATLGCHSVGFNIEETEGVNTERRPPTRDQAEEFWRRVLTWSRSHRGPVIRELERISEYLSLARSGQKDDWDNRLLDPIPTVTWNGDVVLLSPELADTSDAAYGDFLAGNVREKTIAQMLREAPHLRYVREFLTGLERCQAECEFFDFCRGAQAGNRYFENGSLATTETNYCRVSRQALVMALSTTAKKEPIA
ncbi:cyclophane-forming radical SAM peptide maturase AmcB [Streptomyces sp. NPDC000405]|uniref:cyclophane-forming radical SAM peptide maturase AmcB n=1 Tax=Streptomyces sp. NPDC000405 TaxID=3161033 RepID=UPI00398C9B3F